MIWCKCKYCTFQKLSHWSCSIKHWMRKDYMMLYFMADWRQVSSFFLFPSFLTISIKNQNTVLSNGFGSILQVLKCPLPLAISSYCAKINWENTDVHKLPVEKWVPHQPTGWSPRDHEAVSCPHPRRVEWVSIFSLILHRGFWSSFFSHAAVQLHYHCFNMPFLNDRWGCRSS